jgi:hypothetical protein
MPKNDHLSEISFALVALGGAALIEVGPELFPAYAESIFYIALAALVIGVGGIVVCLISAKRKPSESPADLRDTTPLSTAFDGPPAKSANVSLNARAFELMDAVAGKTDYQADILMRPLLGQSVTLLGNLLAASREDSFCSATISLDERHCRTAFLVFHRLHEGLLALHLGDAVPVRGLLRAVNDREVRLTECELIL